MHRTINDARVSEEMDEMRFNSCVMSCRSDLWLPESDIFLRHQKQPL